MRLWRRDARWVRYAFRLMALVHFDLAAVFLLLRSPGKLSEYLSASRQKYYFELGNNGLPRKRVEDLFPQSRAARDTICLLTEVSHGAGMTRPELFILALITKRLQPKNVFEIGTYRGFAITHVAMNCDSLDGRVLNTLDLPPGERQVSLGVNFSDADREHIVNKMTDYFPVRMGLEDNITQLHGDSATFDFTPYYGKMDLVIVDGAHSYDYVVNDSRHAFELLRDGGVILWHDYAHVG